MKALGRSEGGERARLERPGLERVRGLQARVQHAVGVLQPCDDVLVAVDGAVVIALRAAGHVGRAEAAEAEAEPGIMARVYNLFDLLV